MRIRVILRLSTKCVSMKMIFHKMLLYKMQENHNEDKARKPRLLIIFVESIGQQDLLDISEE